jgi:hypothetical protein
MFVGIGVGVGRQRVSGGGGFDSDYQAVLDYATSLGRTLPSSACQVIQNELVLDLKADGILPELDNFGVFANDGKSDFSRIDWIRKAEYTLGNTPTFTAKQGWTGDGTSSYVDLGVTMDSGVNFDFLNSTGSFGGWSFTTLQPGATSLCGATTATLQLTNTVRGGVTDNIMGNTCGIGTLTTGLYHMNRSALNASQQYINGALATSNTGVTKLASTTNFTALAEGGAIAFSTNTISIIFSGGDLSAKATALYTAINKYMTAVALL